MKWDDIDRILNRLERTDVIECEVQHAGEIVRMKFDRPLASVAHSTCATPAPITATPQTVAINAPAAGFFRQSYPLATIKNCSPSVVHSEQHIGYIEVDSVFCAIVASGEGTGISVLVDDGQLIGFGDQVMKLSTDFSEVRDDGNN